jgi:hypothetical protein
MKVKCAVVEDLLPLYIDEVCSEESREIVEEHLAECEKCSVKFKAQKSNLIVSDDIVKDNLRSTAPFKKIKKVETIKLVLVIISLILIPLILTDIGGDGFGLSALNGNYCAERFLKSVEKGEFLKATNYMRFSGGIYGGWNDEFKYEQIPLEEARIIWTSGMLELKKDGIEIISHSNKRIITDDGFTSGYVEILVTYKGDVYKFDLRVSINSGKVEPGDIDIVWSERPREANETEKMLIERISRVISTYFPG